MQDSSNSIGTSNRPWVDRYLPSDSDNVQRPASDENTFSLATLRGTVYRQRQVLFGMVALALVAGLVITLLTKPVYEAETTVQLDPGANKIVEGAELGVASDESRYMNTQAAVIKSRALAYRVVEALKLGNNPEFIGELAKTKPAEIGEKEWQAQKRELAAALVQDGVNVQVPFDSRIVTVSYKSRSPRMAAEVANGIVDTYVKEDTRRAIEANTFALQYLSKEIETVRAKLERAELSTNAYAKSNGIVGEGITGASGSSGGSGSDNLVPQTVTAASLFAVNTTYTQARAKRIAAEQRWKAISAIPAAQLPEVQQNGVIQSMVTDRSKASTELAQLRQRYGENFPRIVELKGQISALDGQIAKASADIKNSIRNEYEVSLRQEQGLSSELAKVSGDTLTEQDRRVQYNLLNRDAGALRTQLATLLDRYAQISSAAQVNSNKSTKLDPAEIPDTPVSPNMTKNLLIAAVLGFGVAIGLAVLREAFDDRLRSAEDVERKLGLPLLGYTPMVPDSDLSQQFMDPFSPLMEAYSSVRTAVDFAYPGSNRVLLVTSSEPSEGKSLTAATLGRSYARLGRKTLLVEADLRKPSLSHLFADKRPEKGIVEVLLGEAELEEVLLPSQQENLHVLPVGKTSVSPVELLSSPVMIDFIEKVRKDYALVLFDTAPVMGLADAPILSRLVDGTIFIVEANRAHYGQAKTAIRRLRAASANVLGAVLTKYRAADAGQDYNYHYRYYTYGGKNA